MCIKMWYVARLAEKQTRITIYSPCELELQFSPQGSSRVY